MFWGKKWNNKRIRNGITRGETWCKDIIVEMINYEERERERERDQGFCGIDISQQRKLFIALDLIDGDSGDLNEIDTYHYDQNDKLWRKKLFCLKFLKGSSCSFLVKLVNWA